MTKKRSTSLELILQRPDLGIKCMLDTLFLRILKSTHFHISGFPKLSCKLPEWKGCVFHF